MPLPLATLNVPTVKTKNKPPSKHQGNTQTIPPPFHFAEMNRFLDLQSKLSSFSSSFHMAFALEGIEFRKKRAEKITPNDERAIGLCIKADR